MLIKIKEADTFSRRMKLKPTSCYLTAEEKRAVEEIAAREERAMAKVIQFAVREYVDRYRHAQGGRFKEPATLPAR